MLALAFMEREDWDLYEIASLGLALVVHSAPPVLHDAPLHRETLKQTLVRVLPFGVGLRIESVTREEQDALQAAWRLEAELGVTGLLGRAL